MSDLNIVGIRLDDRSDHASSVQKVLTNYGDQIVGRFGIPTPDKQDGLIAVVIEAESSDVQCLTDDLRKIDGVIANSLNL